MAGGISWQQFEALVARLQKNFATTGKVTKNEHIQGKNSKTKRQIDATIRATIGTEKILIIVECKKWTRKVDVKAVEAFNSVKADVGAHAAIMVSTKGFSKAAFATADALGITLYKYEDTLTPRWPSGLLTHAVFEIWDLTPTLAQLVLKDGTKCQITDEDTFHDIRSKQKLPLATILRKTWDSLDEAEKYDRAWQVEFDCSSPEEPHGAKLQLGAISKKTRGYKRGRLQFEGLFDQAQGVAKVDSWKMVFDGEFTPLTGEMPPKSETIHILLTTTHVTTLDPLAETTRKLVSHGVLELEVQLKSVFDLPVARSDTHLDFEEGR
ncbi:MAG: restriction endonuclease [Chthoniobacterales bacterium]|nr:restriction endonuclease [Chthoniobacterales bacterium]